VGSVGGAFTTALGGGINFLQSGLSAAFSGVTGIISGILGTLSSGVGSAIALFTSGISKGISLATSGLLDAAKAFGNAYLKYIGMGVDAAGKAVLKSSDLEDVLATIGVRSGGGKAELEELKQL
jgi:hypothetical protein